ncbi:MAG: sodium/proton-translocating pyrophosphatase, partial [Opitutales bacterium]
MNELLFWIPATGCIALLFTFWKTSQVSRAEVGTEGMGRIANSIQQGAMAFLKAEYRVLAVFVLIVAVLLAWSGTQNPASHPLVGLSFVVGAFCSGLAGFLGMKVATKANVRTTNAARESLGKALEVAFSGGAVMGLGVVGLGILGLGGLFLYFGSDMGAFEAGAGDALNRTLTIVTGFSFGASSIALFARVGGGIYTKAADVGADLVGKVEAGIPEDHPLNPATIADNVGDNVGDVAGMGADLFESYVGSMIATMVLGAAFVTTTGYEDPLGGLAPVFLPLLLGAIGIGTSILGTFWVRVKDGGDPQNALNRGEFGSSIVMVACSYFLIKEILPEQWEFAGRDYTAMGVFWATIVGLFAGLAIGMVTEHYTGTNKKPVRA